MNFFADIFGAFANQKRKPMLGRETFGIQRGTEPSYSGVNVVKRSNLAQNDPQMQFRRREAMVDGNPLAGLGDLLYRYGQDGGALEEMAQNTFGDRLHAGAS